MKEMMNSHSKSGLTASFRPPETKICTKCKKEKPIKEFLRNGQSADGFGNNCRDCQKADADKKKAEKAEYGKKYFTF